MIRSAEISKLAHRLGLGDKTIEKDYVLTWVLLAITTSPLNDLLAFKGGTAIKKIYVPDYRFSEDLDFTLLLQNRANDELLAALLRNFLYPIQDGISDFPPSDVPKHLRHAFAFRIIKIHKPIQDRTNILDAKLFLVKLQHLFQRKRLCTQGVNIAEILACSALGNGGEFHACEILQGGK